MSFNKALTDFILFEASNKYLFESYLKLKYEVFVNDMRWTKIPHVGGAALPDAYDKDSIFCCALNDEGQCVGVVRGTLPPRLADMYRAESFTDFMRLDCVRALDGKVATMNALAISRAHRRSQTAATAPLSDLLMTRMIFELRARGAEVILVSALDGPSARLTRRLGFAEIGTPWIIGKDDYSTDPSSPDLLAHDMALIIDDLVWPERPPPSWRDAQAQNAILQLRQHLLEIALIPA